eukprot:364976-Chlamydomonas_euryale.AAC.2
MTTRPRIAFCSSLRLDVIAPVRRLNRSISWPSTTLRLLSCPAAVRSNSPSAASSRTSTDPSDASSSADSSDTTSSEPLPPLVPPPPPTRGWIDSTVSISRRVSCSWNEMLALACMPKTSGASVAGRPAT